MHQVRMPIDPKVLKDLIKETEGVGFRLQHLAFKWEEALRVSGVELGGPLVADGKAAKKPRLRKKIFDRNKVGLMVALGLSPEFDSNQYATVFRAEVPEEYREIFDAVRIKKILSKLCQDGYIQLVRSGGGRKPARYKVKVPRRERARG